MTSLLANLALIFKLLQLYIQLILPEISNLPNCTLARVEIKKNGVKGKFILLVFYFQTILFKLVSKERRINMESWPV